MDVSGDTRPTQLQFIIKRKTAIPTGEFPPSPPALPNCIRKWYYVNRIANSFRDWFTLTLSLRLVDDFVIPTRSACCNFDAKYVLVEIFIRNSDKHLGVAIAELPKQVLQRISEVSSIQRSRVEGTGSEAKGV